MVTGPDKLNAMPTVRRLEEFDINSGGRLERLIFNHRLMVVVACAVLTAVFAWFAATKLVLNASFEKMIPQGHPYIQNYLENRVDLRALGNSIRVVVENTGGSVYDPAYLEALRQINDDVILTPGVDRAWVKSLWTPAVRWIEVTEEGFQGGPVMPANYDGSKANINQLRANIARSSGAQSLVSGDQRSSMIFVPLLDKNPETQQRLDYRKFSHQIEQSIREKYERAHGTGELKLKIHIVGFAKLVGELIDGLVQVTMYFVAAALIAAVLIFLYTRCLRSTVLVIACSLVAVLWQLGLVSALGFEVDPYSILVPFLVFAIGVSHGAQKMNGILQDVGRGTHQLVAARYTFRRLFLAGLTALLADAVGFAVLMVIDIPVIKELALTASVGVGILVFTNLILLPVLLSYVGVSSKAAQRSVEQEEVQATNSKGMARMWKLLDRFTERRWAWWTVLLSLTLGVTGFVVSLQLKIGDLDPGAPELRPQSVYNRDSAFITANFALSSDQFAVIVKAPKAEGCLQFGTLVEADRMAWKLRQIEGVQTTVSLPDAVRQATAGAYEGSFKWLTLARNQSTLNFAASQSMVNNPELANSDCSVMPVIAYLRDHKAETLDRVASTASQFAAAHSNDQQKFLLAAGSAGIEAATNMVVRDANRTMLLYVYAAVIVLCFITFRSWRAVVVAVIPLMITSVLCEALMVALGMGVKVATLPVIALGVGIGVDYALYLLSVQLALQRQGASLKEAYGAAIQFTGRVVALVGLTLGAAVVTWVWSPIKFQADMGILLTFMFIWNMIGALVLVPALSYFLLRDQRAVDPVS